MKKDFAKYQEVGMRVLALVGLVGILALGSFVTITVVSYAPAGLRYLGSAAVSLSSMFVPAEKIMVTLTPADIGSKKSFVLSF